MSEAGSNKQPQPGQLPEGYDGLAEAKRLLRATRAGALATLTPEGFPFASLVNVATALDGAPILLMSSLSGHTRHLRADPRVSLLLAQGGKGDPLAHPRLTLVGQADCVDEPAAREALKARFLARHPKSALYADFGDFAFWRLEPASGHLNGGFARAARYDGPEMLTALPDPSGFAELEAGALAHLNGDHADALALYATALLGEKAGRWRASGLDPEGLDLALGDQTARLVFPAPVADGDQLRKLLAQMAAQARALPA